jgi:hypothetical protein
MVLPVERVLKFYPEPFPHGLRIGERRGMAVSISVFTLKLSRAFLRRLKRLVRRSNPETGAPD